MTAWHIMTGEYPPDIGGVADYANVIAKGLASAGDPVHVWCPLRTGQPPLDAGVHVHQAAGRFHPAGLPRLTREWDRYGAPRRVLLQWVPHAFGCRSMNLPLCAWLWRRARRGDQIEVVAHEAFLAFREGGWRQDVAATAHRLMVFLLLRAASRVWVTIPAWERALRPYAPARVSFGCLPVPSTIAVADDPDRVARVRARYTGSGTLLAGHIGTYTATAAGWFESVVPELLDAGLTLLVLGKGGEHVRRRAAAEGGNGAAGHLHAAGVLDATELSAHIQACDLFVQPYPDGASGRRTSLMAALAHGRPVVTTVGRLSESFWQETGGVCTVPAGDRARFVAATRTLADDAPERARLACEAHLLYDARFHVRHTLAALRCGSS